MILREVQTEALTLDMQKRLERIKYILSIIPHVAIATVNEDGSPLNTPVFGTFNEQLELLWCSSPLTQHSRNIDRDGRVFIVVFTPHEGLGLYIAAQAKELRNPAEVERAHSCLRDAKSKVNASMADISCYQGDGLQRLYCAVPTAQWVNMSTKDASGAVIYDHRVAVELSDLLP